MDYSDTAGYRRAGWRCAIVRRSASYRNALWLDICTTAVRSLRHECSAFNNGARTSFSGAMSGWPPPASRLYNPITWQLRQPALFARVSLGREYAPDTVIVPEEKKRNRALRLQCLHTNISVPTGACATKSGYPNRHHRSWRQPFFNQRTQGFFCGVHRLFPLGWPRPVAFAMTHLRPQGVWLLCEIDTGHHPTKPRQRPARLCR